MSRKRKELPVLENIEITGIAAEGKSIAKIKLKPEDENPIVIFIPYGAPGDIVDIKIDKKKHNYAEAHIIEIKKPSPLRIAPKCENFGSCGGCKWQQLPYTEQLKFKKQQVEDALKRIAKVEFPEIKDTLPSRNIWNYRNKMEYTFSDKRWRKWEDFKTAEGVKTGSDNALGFHIPGAFDKVLHIEKCYLQDNIADEIRNSIYDFAIENDYSFYNIKNNRGLLRTLMIRNTTLGEIMVCLSFGEDDPEKINCLLNALVDRFPQITSLLYVINKKLNDTLNDLDIITFKGKDYIEEKMEGLRFRINAKSFYQTNSVQAFELYKIARDFAGLKLENDKKTLVYDLYTGAGTIANFVSPYCDKVIGIEYVEEAIKDARINSEINGINNTSFYAGDMKDVLTHDFIKENGRPDIMIIDPPRAGMHEDVVNVILNTEPEIIVYVSCNPATQARDIALLDEKYVVTDVQPVDMFPHTHHVENVARLELKNRTEK